MRNLPHIVEIYIKLEQLKMIRDIQTNHGIQLDREEKKIRKQYHYKYLLTQCLSSSKSNPKKQCSNSRVNGANLCYKHNRESLRGVHLYRNEFHFLLSKLEDMMVEKKQISSESNFQNSGLLSYEHFVDLVHDMKKKQLFECLKICGKRMKIKDLKTITPKAFESLVEPFFKPDQENKPFVLKQCHKSNRCMARISLGRQCINVVRGKYNYCALHTKNMPYGDIRIAPLVENHQTVEKNEDVLPDDANTVLLRGSKKRGIFILDDKQYKFLGNSILQET